MSKIRVAHIITRLCRGGAQENTFHTVRLHDRDRYEADLICGTNTGEEGSLEEDVEAAGIQLIRESNLVREVNLVKDYRALRGLTSVLRKGNYDIVHTHTSKAGFLGRLAAKYAKTPIVAHTPHGNIFDGYFSHAQTTLYIALEQAAAKWTDKIVELTDGGIESYLRRNIGQREQYATIFSGIDLSRYGNSDADRKEFLDELGIADGTLLVGGVGRLEPVKGFCYLLEAALEFTECSEPITFVHAGTGSLENELHALAKPLGDRFRFLGLRNDISRVMAGLDILVVPSLNEGMGRVVLEAGAAGTPVIGSEVGGIPEVVHDGHTGLIVPPRDASALVTAIEGLLATPSLLNRMGENAHNFVVPDFSLENMVQHIESLYESLIQEKNIDDRR
ncbi:MAG: glycosyltransferase [Candidatus Hydrogenedentota bacterium]